MWYLLPNLKIKCLNQILLIANLRFEWVSVLSSFEMAKTYFGTLMEPFFHFKSFTERQMYYSDTMRLHDSSQHKHLE